MPPYGAEVPAAAAALWHAAALVIAAMFAGHLVPLAALSWNTLAGSNAGSGALGKHDGYESHPAQAGFAASLAA